MKPLRILAVDDDPSILELYVACFGEGGHQVQTANDPCEGILDFIDQDWDLVITDHSMPKVSGAEFASEIKRLRPSMPIVMVSGTIDELPEEIRRGGTIDAFVRKPFTFAELVVAVEKATQSKFILGEWSGVLEHKDSSV